MNSLYSSPESINSPVCWLNIIFSFLGEFIKLLTGITNHNLKGSMYYSSIMLKIQGIVIK